jgi:hypothetical protein
MTRPTLAVFLLFVQALEAGRNPATGTLPLIDELNAAIQQRLLDPAPGLLGMSRIAWRSSLGRHFKPVVSDRRDFVPENESERRTIETLEGRKLQVGLYLFGLSVLRDPANAKSYRALKGPAAMTAGTRRPNWYPSLKSEASGNGIDATQTETLPDWNAIYPIAQRAMRSFKDGGSGFETELQGWTIAARPSLAINQQCVTCHRPFSEAPIRQGQPIGGVLYAFRSTGASR